MRCLYYYSYCTSILLYLLHATDLPSLTVIPEITNGTIVVPFEEFDFVVRCIVDVDTRPSTTVTGYQIVNGARQLLLSGSEML